MAKSAGHGGIDCVCGDSEDTFNLNKNILFEVLRRVDPVTLAVAGCVNTEFRSVCEEEDIWEELCKGRWPSTRASEGKSISAVVGGYRKLYARCCPSIVTKCGIPAAEPSEGDLSKPLECDRESRVCPSDFISMVDVVYGDQSLFSKTVEGFPGAEGDLYTWFSQCAFRIDLLKPSGSSSDQDPTRESITIDLPFVASRSSNSKGSSESDRAKLWRLLCDELRVSWILIDRKTKTMANLASWKPLGGFRYWLCDDQFLLRFGSVLPGAATAAQNKEAGGEIQCNISVVCAVTFADTEAGEAPKATLRLTELSLQLEDPAGALANGEEGLAILRGALTCSTSTNHQRVMDSYNRYHDARNKVKDKRIRDDARMNMAAAIAGSISICLSMSWIWGYWS